MALPAALLAILPDIVKNGINLLDRKFPSAIERQRAEQEYQRDLEESIQAAWRCVRLLCSARMSGRWL